MDVIFTFFNKEVELLLWKKKQIIVQSKDKNMCRGPLNVSSDEYHITKTLLLTTTSRGLNIHL